MNLPDLIEIVPLEHAPRAVITVPGSKSITNRALILGALARGKTVLQGALWSEDSAVMVDCLRSLGFEIQMEPDPGEPCNRQITIHGQAGRIPNAGTGEAPLELFVGNAGTAARFLAALVCLGNGAYRLKGVPRMHARPQAALFRAMRELGYRVDAPNDRLPAIIHGSGPRPGRCSVDIAESSQFASALLLSARTGQWEVAVQGENAEESPYVAMTEKLMRCFLGQNREGQTVPATSFQIEPDTSSGSYFLAANHLLARPTRKGFAQAGTPGSPISIRAWPDSGWQIDANFPKYLPLPARVSRQTDLGDSIMTGMVMAPFASHPVCFTDLGRLRMQECERVQAMRVELSKCGARVMEEGDTLTIEPSQLYGAEIETYSDHRMAMCFAVLGLVVQGMRIRNPACVRKTFPDFFQKLAAPPPAGLGARLLAANGTTLAVEDLLAG